jgi:hypothetical protein
MAWFNNTSDVQVFVGKNLDKSTAFGSYIVYLNSVTRTYLVKKWLPVAFFVELENLTSAASVTPIQGLAIRHVRDVLAWFIVLEMQSSPLRTNENGSFRHGTGDTHKADKDERAETRLHSIQHGYEALERLLLFLKENASSFPLYENSIQHEKLFKTFFSSAEEFAESANRQIDRYTFENMLGIVEDVEVSTLSQYLPVAFLEAMRTKYRAQTLATKEQLALAYLCKSVAALSLNEAAIMNIIEFQGNTVFVKQSTGNDAKQQQTFNPHAIDAVKRLEYFSADRNRAFFKKLVKDHYTEFPLLFKPPQGINADGWGFEENKETVCNEIMPPTSPTSNCNNRCQGACRCIKNRKIVTL